jgi:hypothetical protein
VEQVIHHQLVLRKEIQVVQQLTELAQEVAVVVEQSHLLELLLMLKQLALLALVLLAALLPAALLLLLVLQPARREECQVLPVFRRTRILEWSVA